MFVLLFYACFRNEEFLKQYGDTFFAIVWAMVGINAIVEWAVCGVFGTAILKTLTYFINRYDKKKAAKNENAETSENADENEDDFEQFTAPINSETPFDNQDDSDFETQEENEDISKE